MRVVAFTGMPGAGKTEAVAVAKARGIPVVRMGDFVWAETQRRGLDLVDANVGRVAAEMRTKEGMDYWARVTCDEVLSKHAAATLLVIDGVRNPEEVETFRHRLGRRFELVAITATQDARVERLFKRGRSDDPARREAILARDEREIGWGIQRSIERADRVLVNEGDLETLRRDVGRFLDELGR